MNASQRRKSSRSMARLSLDWQIACASVRGRQTVSRLNLPGAPPLHIVVRTAFKVVHPYP